MKLYTDGYLLISNPSPIGGGYSIVDKDNNLLIHSKEKKEQFTNNEAEVMGIIHAAALVDSATAKGRRYC